MKTYEERYNEAVDMAQRGDGKGLLAALMSDLRLYAELLFKIETKDSQLVPLVLNHPQRMLHDVLEKHLEETGQIRAIVLKARQQGVSTYIAGRVFRKATLNEHTHGVVIANEGKSTDKIFRMYRRAYDHLPAALQPMTKYNNRGELNFENPSIKPEERRSNPGLDSSIGVYTAGGEAGRGSTATVLHCSEVAFWPDAEGTMTALLQTTPKGDAARGTEIYLESTANGVGGWFYDKYWAAKQGKMGEQFIAIFLPWYLFEAYRMKVPRDIEWTEEELRLMNDDHADWDWVNPATGEKRLSAEQAYWRRSTVATEFTGNVKKFQQEYPLTDIEAFVSSGDSFFDMEDVHERLRAIKTVPIEPVFVGEITTESGPAQQVGRRDLKSVLLAKPHGHLKIWHQPEEGKRYVIFADVSSGESAGDDAVVEIFGVDGRHCAEWGGKIDADDLADVFYAMGKLYNWAWGTPEANNHGATTIIRLNRVLRYRGLYYRKKYDRASEERTEQVGWVTSKVTRNVMLDTGRELFKNGDVEINSVQVLQQMTTFVRNTAGKYEAMKGEYDDYVMAYCGACMMLAESGGTRRQEQKTKTRRVAALPRRRNLAGW